MKFSVCEVDLGSEAVFLPARVGECVSRAIACKLHAENNLRHHAVFRAVIVTQSVVPQEVATSAQFGLWRSQRRPEKINRSEQLPAWNSVSLTLLIVVYTLGAP